MRTQKKKIFKQLPSFIERLLERLNQRLLGFSEYLQKKTNSYSATKKKCILFLFCGAFVTVSTLLIIGSWNRKYLNSYSVTPIRVVPLIKNRVLHPGISNTEFNQIHKYKIYLNHLPVASKDSLLVGSPHMEDTINYLEALYQQQIKK